MKYILPFKLHLIMALITSVFSIILTLLGPILIGRAIDQIISPGNIHYNDILKILAYFVLLISVSALLQWAMGIYTNSLAAKSSALLRKDIFDKFNRVPLQYIDTHSHGDLISRVINDAEAVNDGLLQTVGQFFPGITTIAAAIVIMISINYQIALVVILLTPLSLLVIYFISKNSGKRFNEQQLLQGELAGIASEYVTNQKLVQAFSYEERAEEKFNKCNRKLYTVGLKAQFASSLSNPVTRFMNYIVYITIGIIGAWSAVNGFISVGQITSFLIYTNHFAKPFNEITAVLTQLQTAVASAGRIFDVLDTQNEPAEPADAIDKTGCRGDVMISDISFSYKKEQKLIEHFSVNVRAGQRVAIVGPTGCGKTTLINLLMAFYDVQTGNIFVDNIPIKNITKNSLRSLYGMVLQDSWLIQGTVKENISFGKPDAADEEIIEAAKSAYAHSFIKKMKRGYDTFISRGGGNLSEGQKQLLCIARAMLMNPPMLILDEATSSIDTLTEIRVQKAFQGIMQGKTCFIVAHRLSTIKEADIILVMKDGNIIEQGDHNTLIMENGFYKELYYSQFAN